MNFQTQFFKICSPAVEGPLARFCFATLMCICTVICGCGNNGPVVVSGVVTCAGAPVEQGDVTFIPLDGTGGAGGGGDIIDGAYRIDGRGGVLPGKYRVMVNAFKKTGRKIKQSNGFETSLVDQTQRVGSVAYASADSPLVLSVDGGSSNPVDIEIPDE